jgi:hypothetical protein
MNTLNSNCTPVTPPGTIVSSTTVKQLFTPISFPNPRSTRPFPPIAQAYYNNGILEVSALVFVDSTIGFTNKSFSVYCDNSQTLPTFYVSYDEPETKASSFTMFQVSFEYPMESQPREIQTIVWDEDPTGSRGTVTNVQP